MMIFLLKFVILIQAKCVEMFSADRFYMGLQPRRAHYFRFGSIVCYTLPELLHFFSCFTTKLFSPTADYIDYNFS